MDGDGQKKAPALVRDSRRKLEHARIVLVVLVANAELARVAVTLVAVADAEPAVAPPLHFDDVLSFIRRRGLEATATSASPPQEGW